MASFCIVLTPRTHQNGSQLCISSVNQAADVNLSMPSCQQTNNKQTISTKQPNNKQMSASSFQPFPSRTALGLHGKKCPAKSSTRRAKTKRQWVTWFWPSGYHHLLCATAFIVIYAFFDKCAHRLEHHMPSSRIGSLVFSSVVSKTVNRKKGADKLTWCAEQLQN